MKNVITLIIALVLSNLCLAQSSTYGNVTTPKGNFHAIIVFVQFENNQNDNVPGWTYNSFPSWASNEELFNVDPNTIGNKNNLSKWYDDMSMGQFKFTAEVFPNLVTVNSSGQSSIATTVPFTQADWARFDNRTNLPNYAFDNTDIVNYPPDGKLDYVIFVYRQRGSTGGGAAIPGGTNFGLSAESNPFLIEDGFTFTKIGTTSIRIIQNLFIHEFGHNLFNANHFGSANNVVGKRFFTSSMWATATTTGSRIFNTMNAWERWYLGWAEIKYDIKDVNDNGVYSIKDFVTSGDAIRVKIPNESQYLWIEYHQKLNTDFDNYGFLNNASGPVTSPTPGVYMYIEDVNDDRAVPLVDDFQKPNRLKPLHAHGHFDYKISDNSIIAPEWWGDEAFDFTEIAPNPFGEHHQASLMRNDYDNDGTIVYFGNPNEANINEHKRMYRKNNFNDLVAGPAGEDMAFLIGDKAGLSHNPAIANIQNYNKTNETVDPISINNISVEVVSYDLISQSYQIKILFNDSDVDQDTRWTGNLELTTDIVNPINNPQRIDLKSGNKITLDQNLTPTKETPVLQEDGSTLFSHPSLLILKSGTITTIENGAELLVTNGSTLKIESGATVIVQGSGKITIEDDSYLCIENGATINLQDVNSELHVNNSSIGINPKLISTGINASSCIDICNIQNLITGAGKIIGKTFADAGEDQIICSNPSNNVLGGTPAAVGGIAPYTYSWTPTTYLDDPSSPNPTLTAAPGSSITYTLQVTEGGTGCIGTDDINLIIDPATSYSITTTNSLCSGTSTATVHVPCGNPDAYTYLWSDPQLQTTATATGLFAGKFYTVQVTDASGNIVSLNVILPAQHGGPTYDYINPVITSTTTWNSTNLLKVKGEVVVKRGGKLTILNSDVEFSYDLITELYVEYPRARITVEQGGILNVVNSTLTGCSDGKWDGIEAWGDATTASRSTGVSGDQGSVAILNSTIKNALKGVFCNRSNLKNLSFRNNQGAKLSVLSGSKFINNRQAIVFDRYQHNSANEIKNSSFIYNLSEQASTNLFTARDLAMFPEVIFIEANNYMGLTVGSNSFNNQNYHKNVTGIKTTNTDITISSNSFLSLETGLDLAGINSLNAVAIAGNKFYNCNKGAFLKGITGSEIQANTFHSFGESVVYFPTIAAADTIYGLYLLDCNMYQVEINTFEGNPNSTINTVGVYVYNTDPTNNTQTNQIYKNTFNNLTYASFGNGENGSVLDPNVGLTIKCNSYVGNNYDILTTVAPGISTRQGAPGDFRSPTGNRFADACGAITEGEIFNGATVGPQPNSYEYWHHNTAGYIPDVGCYSVSVVPKDGVFTYDSDQTNGSCPNTLLDPCGDGCKDSLVQVQLDNINAINQLTSTLNGGATEEVLNVIATESKSGGQLKKYLQQKSPLSSEVLIALINSGYSSGIVKQIVLQNSPLSNNVLLALLSVQPSLPNGIVANLLAASAPLAPEILNLAIANNYPAGIINQINQNQLNAPQPISATQLTEATTGGIVRANNLINNRLIRSYLHEIDNPTRFTSIKQLLNQTTVPVTCKACAVEASVRKEDYPTALQEINTLEQENEVLEFCDLQKTLIDMETMPDKMMSIKTDSTLKSKVETVALQTNKKGSIHARNLLNLAFNKKVKETFHFPQQNMNGARIINSEEEETKEIKTDKILVSDLGSFNLYPNPNRGNFTLEYQLENNLEAKLEIMNLTGKIVYRETLIENKGKIGMKANLPVGIYLITIKNSKSQLLYYNKVAVIN